MKRRTQFNVHLTTEFGLGLDRRTCKTGETAEETFMNAWKSLPKRHDKNWVSIDFEFEGKSFDISSELFRENRFDFELTAEDYKNNAWDVDPLDKVNNSNYLRTSK